MIRSTFTGIVLISALFVGCATGRNGPPASVKVPDGPHTLKKLSVEERHDLLLRAQAMTTNDDMREQLQRVETKVDGLAKRIDILETKVDALPTKADLTGFATKADLTGFATKADLIEFKDEIIKNVRILTEEAKASAQKAAEGYGATLKRIERKLGERNNRVRTRLSDHDKVLANHNDRLVALEPPLRR